MMALVRGVIAASTRATFMLWSLPTSTSTGVAPTWWITAIVAMKVCETVMTSSPGPMSSASSRRRKPSVQLLTPTASFVPTKSARLCSKSSICWRMIRSPFERTSRIVAMTSVSMRRNSLPGSQNLTDTSVAPCDDLLDGLQDRFFIETMHGLQVILITDGFVELRPQPDAPERRTARLELGHDLGHRPAEAAFDAVLLERENVARLGRSSCDRVLIQRLDRMHAEQPDTESLAGQGARHLVGRSQHAPRCDEGHVGSIAHGDGSAQHELRVL